MIKMGKKEMQENKRSDEKEGKGKKRKRCEEKEGNIAGPGSGVENRRGIQIRQESG